MPDKRSENRPWPTRRLRPGPRLKKSGGQPRSGERASISQRHWGDRLRLLLKPHRRRFRSGQEDSHCLACLPI